MWGKPELQVYPVERFADTYVEITSTPLVALLSPGGMSMSERFLSTQTDLNPYAYSYDPDAPEDKTGMTFEYFCKREFESFPMVNGDYDHTTHPIPKTMPTSDGGGCFGNGPDKAWYKVGKYHN
ncbi:unnamed protein product [Darwinula stevensoni]|uniref:Uncharacterized protein n=1 Tax=Darwinula stevensoni TaxID=69355 RepID=A0A7R8X6X4_9CRUS|nr:unnamed protein product [Darwinula stevensoni]CAG0879894.1 unnamed protein product [Darwinula stevensoni]